MPVGPPQQTSDPGQQVVLLLQTLVVAQHAPPMQLPPVHASPLVLFVGDEQIPVPGLQVPGFWHWLAGQTTGLLPTQTPAWQVSV